MGYIIRADVRQAVLSWRLLLAGVAFCGLLFLSSFETILSATRFEELLINGFHGKLVYDALSSDAALLALPILCTLPYGAAYIEDIKTGFIKLYISRSSRRGYVLGKFAGCFFSGGLVPVLGTLLAYGISTLIFSPMEAAVEEGAEAVVWLWDTLAVCGRLFLSGGFWAFWGMALSAYMESKYIPYAAPFVTYYLFIILHERYLPALYVIDPKGWLWPEGIWPLGAWSAAVFVLELAAIALLCFAAAVQRRVSEL